MTQTLPDQIRVSIGTATVLGLQKTKMDAAPTTAYLMTYHIGKCIANCGFCPQARGSKSSTELLSRVTWSTYPVADVLAALAVAVEQQKIRRVCIQALNYPQAQSHLTALVKKIKAVSAVAVSVSCQPQYRAEIEQLKAAGVDRLGIALDGATEAVFDRVKGSAAEGIYRWETVFRLLSEALEVFGRGNVSTHIIVGLGESERETAELIQRCVDLGVLPALFAFTPVRGTALEKNAPPPLTAYRRLQLARYLIAAGKTKAANMRFDADGRILAYGIDKEALNHAIEDAEAFRTSGCPDCNRPYYNEKPSGPLYNYPKKPNGKEIEEIKSQLAD
ncbi:MAG: radical SAM protein [Candidatus Bathyarchaeota archaeon]|nr:radical SAM protein [Candidatus Bathyarchaeota archaeon]